MSNEVPRTAALDELLLDELLQELRGRGWPEPTIRSSSSILWGTPQAWLAASRLESEPRLWIVHGAGYPTASPTVYVADIVGVLTELEERGRSLKPGDIASLNRLVLGAADKPLHREGYKLERGGRVPIEREAPISIDIEAWLAGRPQSQPQSQSERPDWIDALHRPYETKL